MRLRDDRASLVLAEEVVVENAPNGLEENQPEEREADYRVVVFQLEGPVLVRACVYTWCAAEIKAKGEGRT